MEAESCPQAASESDRHNTQPKHAGLHKIPPSIFSTTRRLLEPTCHQNPNPIVSPNAEPSQSRTHPVNLQRLMPIPAPGMNILSVGLDTGPGLTGAFRVKAFIKTNQWPEYCGSSIAGVKKKRREIVPIGFLNDRAKRGFYPVSPYGRLRVDSRTASSGAILRWTADISRFSRTPLMPSITRFAAIAPIASMGWRIVVSGGV